MESVIYCFLQGDTGGGQGGREGVNGEAEEGGKEGGPGALLICPGSMV